MRSVIVSAFASQRHGARSRASLGMKLLSSAQAFDPGKLVHQCQFDVVVVGAGIVGLATARDILQKYPKKTVCVLEKEHGIAVHQVIDRKGS